MEGKSIMINDNVVAKCPFRRFLFSTAWQKKGVKKSIIGEGGADFVVIKAC